MEQSKVIPLNEPSANSQTALERMIEAKKHARLLLGCFRTGDANDPEVYISAVVAVLSNYPTNIMRAVCDPVKGLPSQVKWLPTVAEVVDACRRLHDYDLRIAERRRCIEQQLKERRALPPPKVFRGTIGWRQAEQMMVENPNVRIVGVFDKDRTIPYRG